MQDLLLEDVNKVLINLRAVPGEMGTWLEIVQYVESDVVWCLDGTSTENLDTDRPSTGHLVHCEISFQRHARLFRAVRDFTYHPVIWWTFCHW
jgi:hypothetical protein